MRFLQSDFQQTKKFFNALKSTKKEINTEVGLGEVKLYTTDIKVRLKNFQGLDKSVSITHADMETLCKMKTKGDITFEDKVCVGGRKTNIDYLENTLLTRDFKFEEAAYISYECKALKETLKNVVYSKCKDESRPILTGVSIKDTEFVTVDGYRITLKLTNAIYSNPNVEKQIIIPGCLAEMLVKVLPSNGDCQMFTDGELVQFKFDNAIITSVLLRGEYLNYNQVLSQDSEWVLKTNRAKMIECVQFFLDKAVDKTKSEAIKLNLNVDGILTVDGSEIKSKYLKTGYKDTSIYTDGIFFNPKYLKESLEHINDDEIEIHLISSLTPMIIHHSKGKDLILPIRKK